MGTYFLQRDYPCALVEEAALKARRLDRHSLLYPPLKPDSDDNQVILTTQYHPNDCPLKEIVAENWDMLGKGNPTAFLQQKKMVMGYRRPPNLRDLLVRSKIKPINTHQVDPQPPPLIGLNRNLTSDITHSSSLGDLTTDHTALTSSRSLSQLPGIKPRNICKNKKCRYCPLIDTSGNFTCHATQIDHTCMKNISCKSSNLIYLITCNTCGLQYVGQTKRKLSARFQGHFYNIKKGLTKDGVGSHFSRTDHHGTDDLQIRVLEFIRLPPNSTRALSLRLRLEKKWIHKLRCPAPSGLNIMD
jgi:hypothetical protein